MLVLASFSGRQEHAVDVCYWMRTTAGDYK